MGRYERNVNAALILLCLLKDSALFVRDDRRLLLSGWMVLRADTAAAAFPANITEEQIRKDGLSLSDDSVFLTKVNVLNVQKSRPSMHPDICCKTIKKPITCVIHTDDRQLFKERKYTSTAFLVSSASAQTLKYT